MEVTERVSATGSLLTAAERRAAQVVLDRPQLVAFGTVADLARHADVGAATVVRLAAKLGYDGFSALQDSIQQDLLRQLRPAVERIRELGDEQPSDRHRDTVVANVIATLDAVEPGSVDQAVDLLTDVDRPVLVLVGDAAHGVGRQFEHDLSALRPGVAMIWGPDVAVRRQLAVCPPDSVVVAIDMRRYERWVLEAAELAHTRGLTIVALSDGPLSPLAANATLAFTLAAGSVSPFESQIGTLALLELLVAIAAERLRPLAVPRLEQAEQAWNDGHTLTTS
ncbi:MurR/RpiR family transcriptional regulator [soil metagenome]